MKREIKRLSKTVRVIVTDLQLDRETKGAFEILCNREWNRVDGEIALRTYNDSKKREKSLFLGQGRAGKVCLSKIGDRFEFFFYPWETNAPERISDKLAGEIMSDESFATCEKLGGLVDEL